MCLCCSAVSLRAICFGSSRRKPLPPPHTHSQPAKRCCLATLVLSSRAKQLLASLFSSLGRQRTFFEQLAMATGIVLIDTILHLRSNPKRSLQWYRVSASCRVTLVHWRVDLHQKEPRTSEKSEDRITAIIQAADGLALTICLADVLIFGWMPTHKQATFDTRSERFALLDFVCELFVAASLAPWPKRAISPSFQG